MSCDGITYIPIPANAWYREETKCTSNNDNNMLIKGNVLQYKNNASNFSQNQIYSKLITGKWINKNTSWANQSETGITNPNNGFLKRINSTNIAINYETGEIIGPTNSPITCPIYANSYQPPPALPQNLNNDNNKSKKYKMQNIFFPIKKYNSTKTKTLTSNPNENVLPYRTQQPSSNIIVIQDGGNLLCNVIQNPCNPSQIIQTKSYNPCNISSDSDVPGKIIPLCWDNSIKSWYPKQKTTMSTSNSKWPTTSGPPNNVTYIAATAFTS